MTTIQSIIRFTIKPGKLEDFKQLAKECLQLVREKDTGTLRYEWFFNADETECVLHEEYADLDASGQHFRNMGDKVHAIRQLADASYEMWGDPGEMHETIQAKGCQVYLPFLSLNQ